jgi:hypothetical protein
MPKKKVFDAKKLIKMVKDDKSQSEIMKAFGFKTAAQVKNALSDALVETGELVPINGGSGGYIGFDATEMVKIGKQGSIIIPAKMVNSLGLGSEGVFIVRKNKVGVVLKKV